MYIVQKRPVEIALELDLFVKFIKFILIINCFIFVGCSSKEPVFIKYSSVDSLASYHISLITIPNSIYFNGYKFYLKELSDSFANYFLGGENSQIWTQRFSLKFAYGLDKKKLVKYQYLLKELYISSKFGKSDFWFSEIKNDHFFAYQIYYPIEKKLEFNSYDMGINYTKSLDCGIISYVFNEKFNPHKGIENIKKIAEKFIKNGDISNLKISCKKPK